MNIISLYENPELYEAECREVIQDDKFWKHMIKLYHPKSILEIGCGTGRIAEYVIEDIELYGGIDISKVFLEYLRGKSIYRNHKDKFRLYESDILFVDLKEKYDMVILSCQFLGHVYSYKDLFLILKTIKRVLNKRGKVIIDYCNPDLRFLETHKEYQFCYEFQMEDIGCVKVFERNQYTQNLQINQQERRYTSVGKFDVIQNIPFRIYFPQELDALLELGGYKIDIKAGDYDMNIFSEYCVKQIYILSSLEG